MTLENQMNVKRLVMRVSWDFEFETESRRPFVSIADRWPIYSPIRSFPLTRNPIVDAATVLCEIDKILTEFDPCDLKTDLSFKTYFRGLITVHDTYLSEAAKRILCQE